MAQHRPQPRRPIDCRRGRERAAQRRVLRRRWRRAVEDDGCREHLGAGHRRSDQQLVGRRGRGVRVEPRRRVHRHGRVVHPRQHHARRRRLQVDRCRSEVGARRLRRHRCDLQDPHPSNEPRHRLRRQLRPLRRPERGARRVQDDRRRQDVEEGALSRQSHRRRRRRDRSPQSQRDVCRALGGVPHRVSDVERRPGQRTVQVD